MSLLFYSALVKPYFQTYVQCWVLYCNRDMNILERVQTRAMKLMIGLERISHKVSESCDCSALTSGEQKAQGDLINVRHPKAGCKNNKASSCSLGYNSEIPLAPSKTHESFARVEWEWVQGLFTACLCAPPPRCYVRN